MNLAHAGLKIETVWFDSDMLELKLRACSADFSGQANFYAALDEPSVFAKHIEGFPNSINDVREFEFGSTNLQEYGGARIKLYCRDSSGHLVVQVEVYKNPIDLPNVSEAATIRIDAVPATVDSFVDDLKRMKIEVGEYAELRSEN
jgi:hypothetical protein